MTRKIHFSDPCFITVFLGGNERPSFDRRFGQADRRREARITVQIELLVQTLSTSTSGVGRRILHIGRCVPSSTVLQELKIVERIADHHFWRQRYLRDFEPETGESK